MAQASMTLPQMSLLSEPGAVVDPALQSSWPDQRFALESHSARSQTTTPDPVQSGGSSGHSVSSSEAAAFKRSAQLVRTRRRSDRGSSSQSQRRRPSMALQGGITYEVGHSSGDVDNDIEMPSDADGAADSKERSREKNKVAAAKCRAKKRENMELIETNHRTLSAENSYLRKHEQQLRETVAQLRTLALDHQHCNCGVHQYNMFQAGHLARGLGGLHRNHFSMEGPAPGLEAPESASSGFPGSDVHLSPMSPTFENMQHLGMTMDREQDDLISCQQQMDPLYFDMNGSSEYTHDSRS